MADSLQPGNRAGFYWDYSPPPGTDTAWVFAGSDLATARLIRETINGLQRATGTGQRGLERTAVSAGIDGLRNALANIATRGIHLTPDAGAAQAGGAAAAASVLSGGASPALTAIGGGGATGDWAATSVTLQIVD